MERSTIKLEVSLINKIKEIQALNCYKSVNETVKHILPQGTVTPDSNLWTTCIHIEKRRYL